jgi:ABC-type oligopeptide transport system substrate-binding subunit
VALRLIHRPERTGRRIGRVGLLVASLALAVGAVVAAVPAAGDERIAAAATPDEVRIMTSEPSSLDPAEQGDIGSAAVTTQLYESVTAFDPSLVLRPALAESWSIGDDGRTVAFTLRPGLTFSDGTPLTASDVARSWLRVIDPAKPSPLASLLDDVTGAVAYRTGQANDPASVGIRVVGDRGVIVELDRPVGDFPAIVAGATFGIVPPGFDDASDVQTQPVSGGYRLTTQSASTLKLEANDRYWAGRPAIGTVFLVTDLGGRSAVDAYTEGSLDYAPVTSSDAAWMRYDPTFGPDLREVSSLGLTYYGFDVRQPPFDDVRVRQAFAQAVDWRRIAALASDGSTTPATSMVPPGIPGRSEADFLPPFEPDAAKALLADAGYPDGAGFPSVTMLTGGTGHEAAIVAELEDRLGVTIGVESMDFTEYFERLEVDPPAMWALSWVADYPGPNDFLGLLLGTGRTNNYGRWSSADFDAAIEAALRAPDVAAAREAYDRAEAVVRDEAPVVPVEYGTGWALSRDGLLGAGQNGLGVIRMAGLAWSE